MNPVTQPNGPGVAEWYANQIREHQDAAQQVISEYQAEVARLRAQLAEAEEARECLAANAAVLRGKILALESELRPYRAAAQRADATARLQAVEEGSEG